MSANRSAVVPPMRQSAKQDPLDDILPWRDLYRQEMNCQIIHDSLHSRPGWTQEYLLQVDGTTVSYGSIAVGGPWNGKPTAFEFYVLPQYRWRAFDLFEKLLTESGAVGIEVQSNDPLITVMLFTFAENIESESILFHDRLTTMLAPTGVVFRRATQEDTARFLPHQEGAGFLLEAAGEIAGTGGILFHYNRPYGDIPSWHLDEGIIWSPENPNSFFPRYASRLANRAEGILRRRIGSACE